MSEDYLTERVRAEDIILGSLGYGEEAEIMSIESTADGFRGVGKWKDGETFDFESDEDLDELQIWALSILQNPLAADKGAADKRVAKS